MTTLEFSNATSVKEIVNSKISENNLPRSHENDHCEDSAIPNSYEEAVKLLSILRSNAEGVKLFLERRLTPEDINVWRARFLGRNGLSKCQMESLNVIHVAGTKGKGSTCAFTESILRHAGLRTGFYSSPHLVAVRERIRINGKSLSKHEFAKYFFTVFRNLESTKISSDDMPGYFCFLTCLALYTFYHEKVDVVILEVGVGGAWDSTNHFKKPVVTGITSLGLEHQRILGNTLEEIARVKAGIMKYGVPCFTIQSHPLNVQKELQNRASTVNAELILVPPLESYNEIIKLGVDDGMVCDRNASMAIQLTTEFLAQKFPNLLNGISYVKGQPFSLLGFHRDGLANCRWLGRFQLLQRSSQLTYFLDGAHTQDSLIVARDWFLRATGLTGRTRCVVMCLTGGRDVVQFVRTFVGSKEIGLAIFCPIVNILPQGADNWSVMRDTVETSSTPMLFDSIWREFGRDDSIILPSVNQVVEHLDDLSCQTDMDVLVTGSLHLVGTFLSILDPNLYSE